MTGKRTRSMATAQQTSAAKSIVKQSAAGGGRGKKKETTEEATNAEKRGDLPPCCVCNAALNEEMNALQCEICEKKWACAACIDISDELYALLADNTSLHWYCDTCEAGWTSRGQNEATTGMMKLMENLLERVKNIETTLGGGADMAKTIKCSVESGLASYAAVVSHNAVQGTKVNQEIKPMRTIIKEALVEQAEDEKELERRSKNVIIYRVPEAVGTGEASENGDKAFLKDLIEGPLELPQLGGSVKSIVRLGKRAESPSVRPMLVKLATNEDKGQFLANLKKLKTADDRFRKISVAHDLTVKQREAVKGLLEAAKREQDDKEKMEGAPQPDNWAFRVVDQDKVPRVVRIRVG